MYRASLGQSVNKSFHDELEKIAISSKAILRAMKGRQLRLDRIAQKAENLPKGSVAREALEEQGRRLSTRSAEQSRFIEGEVLRRTGDVAENIPKSQNELLHWQMSRRLPSMRTSGKMSQQEAKDTIKRRGPDSARSLIRDQNVDARKVLGLQGSSLRKPAVGDRAVDAVAQGGKDIQAIRAARPFREFKGYDEATFGAGGTAYPPISRTTTRTVVPGEGQIRIGPSRPGYGDWGASPTRTGSALAKPWTGGGVFTPGRPSAGAARRTALLRNSVQGPIAPRRGAPNPLRRATWTPTGKTALASVAFHNELEKIAVAVLYRDEAQ